MKVLFHFLVFVMVGFLSLYAYLNYWDEIYVSFFGDENYYKIYVAEQAIAVTVADSPEERAVGLSGTEPLRSLEGKLFIFDEEDYHGIWMKNMNYPIDIIWINNKLDVVYVEENVAPETYPQQVFSPDEPARYVLEVPSFFANTYKVSKGDKLLLPSDLLPVDVRNEIVQ